MTKASAGSTKKSPRVKVPPTWTGGKCVCCGKIYDSRVGNFSKTPSHWFNGNDGFLPFCNTCRLEMFEFYTKKYGGDEAEAIKRMCMFWDAYYSDALIESAKLSNDGVPLANVYAGRVNMRQYSNKSFDTYLEEEQKKALANGESTPRSRVTGKMIKFWGDGYDEREYIRLQDEYDNLKSRHECKTAVQEMLFKRIALAVLNCERADKTGDTKKIKEANDNLQNLMGSANIKPNQTNDNALAETNTLGTLIEKWENTKPISEPDLAWADVDGMGKYFRVWVLGTILNMFKLKNPFAKEYQDELDKYTAHKPEFQEDDDNSDGMSIRNTIFGVGSNTAGSATTATSTEHKSGGGDP